MDEDVNIALLLHKKKRGKEEEREEEQLGIFGPPLGAIRSSPTM